MPIADLVGRRVRTASGLEFQAPTVRSFFRALEVFGAEIGIVLQEARSLPDGLSPEIAIAPFLMTPDDGRLAYVLEGVTFDLVGAARAMIPFVVPLASKIDGLLGDPSATGEQDDGDVDEGVLLVLRLAHWLHIDPMIVMGWPLGLFLDAVKAFSRPPKDSDRRAAETFAGIIPTMETHEIVGGATQAPGMA